MEGLEVGLFPYQREGSQMFCGLRCRRCPEMFDTIRRDGTKVHSFFFFFLMRGSCYDLISLGRSNGFETLYLRGTILGIALLSSVSSSTEHT